jgi:hypothetical protein
VADKILIAVPLTTNDCGVLVSLIPVTADFFALRAILDFV